MDRRNFLTGSALATAAAAFGLPKTAAAVATATPHHGTPALAHIDLWWKIADKRGTEEPATLEERLDNSTGRRYKIQKITADRRDSALAVLKSLGFVVPHVCNGGGECLHYPRNDMTREETGTLEQTPHKDKWRSATQALHARFDHGSCRVDWSDDYLKEFNPNMPGDVRLTMVMTHPNLTMTPDEVLGMLGQHSLGIVDAKLEIVHEIVKVAGMIRNA